MIFLELLLIIYLDIEEKKYPESFKDQSNFKKNKWKRKNL